MSQESIRAALRANPDGLTAIDLAKQIGKRNFQIRRSVRLMPDVYVDRWQRIASAKSGGVTFTEVFIAVEVPENAPKPN